MAVTFGISNGSGWTTPALASAGFGALRVSEAPDASAIPALLRRRLNTLGRAAAAEMLRLPDTQQMPVVYSSRHGDIDRTLSVLLELAHREPVSPMNFSLAVHNAIPGILSIHSSNTANITSLAALEESLVPALLEAAGLLQEGHDRVLCLFADVPIPAIYQSSCPEPAAPYAASFVLSSDATDRFSLSRASGDDRSMETGPLPEALRFIEFLASDTPRFHTHHNSGLWTLTRS